MVVAHRLSSLINADTIRVLDAEQLLQQGTHTDLLKAKGLYQTMFETQAKRIK